MATLREYFEADFSHTVIMARPIQLSVKDVGDVQIESRIHLDFSSKALFASFLLENKELSTSQLIDLIDQIDALWGKGWPAPPNIKLPAARLYPGELKIEKSPFAVTSKFFGGPSTRHDQLMFTGRIYIYIDTDFTTEEQEGIKSSLKNEKLDPQFRGPSYREKRDKLQIPLAFVSHDSRDKANIARPIALSLQRNLVPVWYDEFSLPVGAKLRESIEAGIKECKKCILIVTKNFISNEGWTKVEFDSVFTKEIFERGNILLPVWHEVTAKEVYDYSPWLANIKAADWSEGEEEVVRKLHREIMKE
jgi:hypothetical protein